MKKRWALASIALWPYACAAFSGVYFFSAAPDEAIGPRAALILMTALTLCAFFAAAGALIAAVRGRCAARELVRESLTIKLVQIPAYLFHFALGLAGLVMSIWGLGLILWAFFVDVITIALSGTVGLSAAQRCRREGLLSGRSAIVYALLSFVFCADVAAAIALFRRTGARSAS